jgi:hypothetical protein
MFDIPITPAANAFVWGFVLVLALIVAIMVVDVLKERKIEHKETKEKKIL